MRLPFSPIVPVNLQKNHMALLEVFRAGRHIDSCGVEREFTRKDIQEIAASYNPNLHEAPILVNHDESKPNKGLIKGLLAISDRLWAIPHKVEEAYKNAVNSGRLPKLSSAFYAKDDPRNPTPGKFYYRHLASVQIPAVKGMESPAFAEGTPAFDGIAIEFGEWNERSIGQIFQGLREYCIEEEGMELADRLYPLYLIEELLRSSEDLNHGYGESTMTEAELLALEARLTADRESLDKEKAEFAERERVAAKTAEYSEWIEPLIAAGKVLPAEKSRLVATLVALSGDTKVEFSEGGESKSLAVVEAFKQSLESRPKHVEYSEISGATDAPEKIEFNAPPGMQVANRELYGKAKAYQAKHPSMDLVEAYKKVGGN